MTEPISPDTLPDTYSLPPSVVESVNVEIKTQWDGARARVDYSGVFSHARQACGLDVTPANWLEDLVNIYHAAGWDVWNRTRSDVPEDVPKAGELIFKKRRDSDD